MIHKHCAPMVHPGDVNTQDFVCTPGSSWRCEYASLCVHTWFILTIWTRKRLCGSCYAPYKYFHLLVHSFPIHVSLLQMAMKFLSRSCVVLGRTGGESGCSTPLRLSGGSNPCVLRVDNSSSGSNNNNSGNNNNNHHQWLEQRSVTITPLQPR